MTVGLKHLPGRHDQKTHTPKAYVARFGIVVDRVSTNEEFAKGQIGSYMQQIPEHIRAVSSLRGVEVYENPEDAATRVAELEHMAPEDVIYVRGAYDRDNGRAIVSLYVSEDRFVEGLPEGGEYSGRNFYHEYAHSLESYITSDGWERAWGEWNYNQDEGFADAFAAYMVAKRSNAGGNSDEMDWFRSSYPVTSEVFEEWSL